MEVIRFIGETLLGELVIIIVGVLFANFIWRAIERLRYGNWQVVITRAGQQIVAREVSPRKVREILEEPADLVTFLKGVVSPYAWITCDLITEGQQRKLLVVDHSERRFLIDLDKNPEPEGEARAFIGD